MNNRTRNLLAKLRDTLLFLSEFCVPLIFFLLVVFWRYPGYPV